MPLAALSDRGAVLRTLEEYDALGAEGFLAKYGYGRARSYILRYEGRDYDSKAIAGVAVGFEFPNEGPLKAKDFSGGIQTVVRKLRQLGFDVVRSDQPVRNPDWTREETILALDLYVRGRPRLPDQKDPEIIALSELLKAYAAQRGVTGTSTFRNPNGVSMKVTNLSRLDGDDQRKGLPHGSGVEDRVWAEFMPDITALAAAAEAIRASIVRTQSAAVSSSTAPEDDAGGDKAVSRGPRPSFGEVVQVREDGENSVYVMRLYGAVERLFPKRAMQNLAVVKIGRSNDVRRRAIELNCGFPPGLDLTWRPLQAQTFTSANAAHDVEQALLRALELRGLTIGGEFAIVPEREVETLLANAMGLPTLHSKVAKSGDAPRN